MKLGVCAAVSEDIALGLNLAGVDEILVWDEGVDRSVLKKWYLEMLEKEIGVMILSPTNM